jgi:hypothetical protein
MDDVLGVPLGYGVIANISETGACVWTNQELDPGMRLSLRVSFANPPEVHEITGDVVWTDDNAGGGFFHAGVRRYGVEWRDATSSCVRRVRELALRALSGRAAHTPPTGVGTRLEL